MKIGIDLLGSENTPQALLKAALEMLVDHPFELHAFGPKIMDHKSIVWHETNQSVSMNDIGVASANDKSTSMFLGIDALNQGMIDAFISAGNTAALLTYSHLHLNKLPKVKRLGFLAKIGTKQDSCYVIDVGANINSPASLLYQFAYMGDVTLKALHGKDPKIGILNMASEKGKGPQHLKDLYSLLENHPRFIGFVEPSTIFNGHCDLVVCDGFTGNILLKTAEAVAQMTLGDKIETTPFDPSSYPGALLCGADKLVMKIHGIGDTRALQKTIKEVMRLHDRDYLTRVKQEISALKEESF